MAKSFYDILGVSKDASADDIKTSYRKLARKYHPDMNQGDKAAAEKFKEINEAYETLSDSKKRAEYDNPSPFNMGGGGFDGGAGFGSSFFDNIFNMFETGQGKSSSSGGGEDIQTEVTLTFEEAAFGVSKNINLTRNEFCSACGGSGSKNGTEHTICSTCNGSGSVRQIQDTMFGRMASTKVCPKCGGTGKTIKEGCPKCGGKGIIKDNTIVKLSFPKGLDNGQVVSVRGEGHASKRGKRGDLIIRVMVLPHKLFKRNGSNLYLDLPVTVTQAVLGDKVVITGLRGDKVTLTIPEGAQHGDVITVRGGGMDLKFGKGDLIVRILIDIPKYLSKDQRNKFKDLDGIVKENQYEKVKDFKKKIQ